MKRFLTLFLSLILGISTFSFVGCKNNDNGDNTPPVTPPTPVAPSDCNFYDDNYFAYYLSDDGTYLSVKYFGGDVDELTVPTSYNNIPVKSLKTGAFSNVRIGLLTILDNIKWGDSSATLEEVKEVCRLAAADEFIESFPEKYDTFIEQGGTNVSGGQKQRLCIARALLKKPKVLILDDSTSAVDTKTDAYIRKSFKTSIPNTTKIIIAQRIASVMDADKIIVMDNGEINAIGTHNELIESCEIYKQVYSTQNTTNDKEVK